MTKKELVKLMEKMPEEAEVVFAQEGYMTYGPPNLKRGPALDITFQAPYIVINMDHDT